MIRNANQIALFFSTYSYKEGVAGVHEHLRLYWEPRMRTQIKKYVADGGNDLHALVLEAVNQLD